MANIGRYCKAYLLSNIRRYPEWKNGNASALADDSIVYVQENYSVTEDVFIDEKVIFDGADDTWKKFCTNELQFSIPDYVDKFDGNRNNNEIKSDAIVVN
jgi:hypothetical protein